MAAKVTSTCPQPIVVKDKGTKRNSKNESIANVL